MSQPDGDPLADLRAYAARIPTGAAFCGETAARIYGLPLPMKREALESNKPEDGQADKHVPIHVAAALGRSKPRGKGITGYRLSEALFKTRTFARLPVLQPIETFITCCRHLSVDEAVVMLDALLTNKEIYPGMKLRYRPVTTIDKVEARLAEVGPVQGIRVARDALVLARVRVASPMETKLRLLLVRGGLPEPEVNGIVYTDTGERIAEVDLLYRDAKIAIEYEGDGHRTNKKIFRNDLVRERRLRQAGYAYIRVTIEEMGETSTLVADLRTRLTGGASLP